MFAKGPGQGYHAAKSRALKRNPNLTCRLSHNGGIRHYRIFDGEKDIGCGETSARASWNKILSRMEAAENAER